MKPTLEWRTSLVVLTAVLAAAGSSGCHPADNPGATRQSALDSSWTPHAFDAWTQGWYTASAGVATDGSGNVATWVDQTIYHRDLTQSVPGGRPHYDANGLGSGVPSLSFSGGQLLSNSAWSSTPSGTEAELTILAVLRSAAPQTASVAAFWDPNGQGSAWFGLKNNGGVGTLDMWRVNANSPGQDYAGSQDLGTTAPHVVAWRYQPATGVMTQVIDGLSTSSTSMPALGPLPVMPLVVGARSLLPTQLFQGNVSELMILSHALSDTDIQNYMDYSRNAWHITAVPLAGGPCRDAQYAPTPSTTRCDDGDPLTYGDHCSQGTCAAGDLPPPGGPADLAPLAWYHANPQEVVITDSGVSTWFDRTQNHRDLMQAFYAGRPTLASWPGNKFAIHFSGGNGLRRDGWSVAPTGSDQAFTVLAVVRPGVASQSAAIAAWWNAGAYSRAACTLKALNGDATPDLLRTDENGTPQEVTGSTALGTAPHALVWRYASNTLTVTADGQSTPPSSLGAIGPITPDSFLVGMETFLPTGLYTGDIAELAVVPRAISETEVAAFDSYVAIEWGGSLCPCGAHAHCAQSPSSGPPACECDPGWDGADCSQVTLDAADLVAPILCGSGTTSQCWHFHGNQHTTSAWDVLVKNGVTRWAYADAQDPTQVWIQEPGGLAVGALSFPSNHLPTGTQSISLYTDRAVQDNLMVLGYDSVVRVFQGNLANPADPPPNPGNFNTVVSTIQPNTPTGARVSLSKIVTVDLPDILSVTPQTLGLTFGDGQLYWLSQGVWHPASENPAFLAGLPSGKKWLDVTAHHGAGGGATLMSDHHEIWRVASGSMSNGVVTYVPAVEANLLLAGPVGVVGVEPVALGGRYILTRQVARYVPINGVPTRIATPDTCSYLPGAVDGSCVGDTNRLLTYDFGTGQWGNFFGGVLPWYPTSLEDIGQCFTIGDQNDPSHITSTVCGQAFLPDCPGGTTCATFFPYWQGVIDSGANGPVLFGGGSSWIFPFQP